ncbi:MAG: DNA primase, partial [Desulfovibrionaceae bacterium]
AIKARLNIADVVRRYVDLRPVSGRWMGACPFHQETKPSFSVNDAEGFFYCFGCQASGDVIDFYMRINGLEFRDALEQLAAEAGVDLGDSRPDPQADARRQAKKRMLEMHDLAREHFIRNLHHAAGQPARDYLQRRGMAPDMVREFSLGYSLDDWHGLDKFLQSKGFSPDEATEAGLLSRNEKGSMYDRFRGRLIFPIQDLSGRVIAFGGRILMDGEPKYLNSSDTPIYKKGDHLYGLNLARPAMNRSRRAILTEGYVDVMSLHQFGYRDACGVLGTALTRDQVRRLTGLCSRVDLIFDGDNAGRKAALKSAEMILSIGAACRVVMLPQGEDVDSLLQTQGSAALDPLLDAAQEGLAFCTRTMSEQAAPREIIAWAQRFLSELESPQLRAYYLPRVAAGLGLYEAELRGDPAIRRGPRNPAPAASAGPGDPMDAPRRSGPADAGKPDEKDAYFLCFAMQYPEYVPALAKLGLGEVLSAPFSEQLWAKLLDHQGEGMPEGLAPQEKAFWARSRLDLEEGGRFFGEQLAQEWEHIGSTVHALLKKNEKERLLCEMRSAQESGDSTTVARCTRALMELKRRDDEQP